MKQVITMVVAVLLLVMVGPTVAGGDNAYIPGFDQLTDAQKAAVVAQIKQQAKANESALPVENLEKWMKLGPAIGQTISSAAKEVNVAVNDFVKTPVGIMTTALIVWHFVGGVVVHMIGAFVIWIVGFIVVTVMLRRYSKRIIIYDENGKVKSKEHEKLEGESAFGWLVAYAAVLGGGLISLFSF